MLKDKLIASESQVSYAVVNVTIASVANVHI